MGRAFTDDDFRAFVLDDSLVAEAARLRSTLRSWAEGDLSGAARRAFAYLPEDAAIRASVYPVIKPASNSFVFETDTDPAIFLFLDPSRTAEQVENTVAHELHHIGYAGACPAPDSTLPAGARRALNWMSGFGEGRAMVAAAGGPDVHPHAWSPPEERAMWDGHVARVGTDLRRMERFFLDLVADALTEEEARERGFAFVVADGVPQGAFYTVGWFMSATIERELGRDRLVSTLCDPLGFLRDYNRAARLVIERGEPAALPLRPPLWSDSLLARLGS